MPRKLYLDTWDGIVEHLVFDDAEKKFHLSRQSDVEPNLDQNIREFNEQHFGWREGLGEKVASIPMGVVLEWMQRYGVDIYNRDHLPAVERLLNDPEWRKLRTRPGVL